jgi:thiamine-phosphate pyrophosphorylase
VFPSLYAIMAADLLQTSELAFAELLAKTGVELIQYRNKKMPSRNLHQVSLNLVTCLLPYRARLIVNDRPDIAALAGAAGVHVGQDDLGVEQARKICGPASWVGISTHTIEQLRAAATTSADYIAVGPIFATSTKENPDPVVGINFIRQVRHLTAKPLVAIGGITLDRAAEVFQAGADSIAVSRDLIMASDPGARAQEFLKLAQKVRFSRN